MKICFLAAAAIMAASLPAAAQPKDLPPAWITATNKPCKIWNPYPQSNETVTWSGACKKGLASGKGVVRWAEGGAPDVEFDGEYADGKRNGPGMIITPDGKHTPGVWSDDELVAQDDNAI